VADRFSIEPFDDMWTAGVSAVCRSLGWDSYADEDVCRRGCQAPGVSTFVAIAGGAVVGFAQVLSDGVVQGYLAQVAVLERFRRRGIARRLVDAAFEASGARRLDLLSDDAQDFYRSFCEQGEAWLSHLPEYGPIAESQRRR